MRLKCILFICLGVTALALAACDEPVDNDPDAGQLDASLPGDDAGSTDGGETPPTPLYALHSAVESPDGRLNYFTMLPSITDESTIDYASAIEVPGRARLYARPELGFFVIGDGEDASLTRYDIEADGGVTAGDRLSLQGLGVTSLGAQAVLFVSEALAYYKDPGQAQVIIWNPSAMEIIDTIELPATLLREDRIASYGDWTSRDGDVFFTVYWYSSTYDRVDPGTSLVRIDTTTNEVFVTEDSRCRELAAGLTIDGSIHYFSGVINAFGHAVYPDDAGQESCSLRISPESDTFDPDYVGGVSDALPDGTSAVVVDASGTDLWAQVVDLSMAPTEPGTTYGEWYATGWTWWKTPLGSTTGATQITTTPGAYSSFSVAGDGFFMLAETEPDYSSTTLLDVSSGTPAPGITFPGFTLDVIRLR